MKYITWTLHKPSDYEFDKFAKVNGAWYSKDYTTIDPDAPQKWGNISRKSFFQMIQKHPDKMYSIGLHEFGVDGDGRVRSTATFGSNEFNYALNDKKTEIIRPCAKSLCYLMHTYPQIKWCLQYLCTNERVPQVLLNKSKQDVFIEECYKITKLYIEKGFPIKGIEIDFEYTWYGSGKKEADAFRDLLSRIKNECCLPLGMELRINMFAMTGKFEPSWYAWHDYETLASAKDKNGNQAVDEFQMMSYDFSWGGSAPGPSTPLWWLEDILNHVKNTLPPHKTFVGNAGYGRRWALGENIMGTTLDFKGLMMAQNGIFIHNEGNTDRKDLDDDPKTFEFFDQDFIPICGVNDPNSDYQITYFHTYDRFKMSSNGGAKFRYMNRSGNEDYVTKYSREQNSVFRGVSNIITEATSLSGVVDKVGSFTTDGKTSGIPEKTTFKGYAITNKKIGDVPDLVSYKFKANGSKRLIAVASFPFYDQSSFDIKINGEKKNLNINNEWYPLLQKIHFYDLGEYQFNGDVNITMGYTGGGQLYGFVICDDYDNNMIGGYIDIPACVYPMMKRGEIDLETGGTNEIIEAQYPKNMRVVGEILRRPPRPAIIWEDMFGSYDAGSSDHLSDITTLFKYYVPSPKGYSKGKWKVYPNPLGSYAYALGDGVDGYSQIMLNKEFTKNILIDIDLSAEDNYSDILYGIRLMANNKENISDGYLVLLDFKRNLISLYKNTDDDSNRINAWTLPKINMTSRTNVKLFIFNGKLTCYINSSNAFQYQLSNYVGGACGIYVNKGKIKLYKYNISSLDRYERMERIKVIVDGKTYETGNVPRNCKMDEFGYLIFSGYPQETGLKPNIVDSQLDPNYKWETDYKNLKLASIPSWKGAKNISINSMDAGIWIKNIYIGDDEGMSVAYNSDRVGFIKTVNMINDYGCKGVAMWTLGQEDPTYYSYLP